MRAGSQAVSALTLKRIALRRILKHLQIVAHRNYREQYHELQREGDQRQPAIGAGFAHHSHPYEHARDCKQRPGGIEE
ncbi:MAG: hypothetical protein ABSD72_13470 [Terracidiphilus sp.]